MIEIFSHRKNAPMAEALVVQLRTIGHTARNQNVRYFDPKQVDKEVDMVYHDGTEPLVPWIYGRMGIQCEVMPGIESAGHGGPTPADAFHLQGTANGGFIKMGPHGPVGTEQPTEEEAWSQGEEKEPEINNQMPFSEPEPADPAPVTPIELQGGKFESKKEKKDKKSERAEAAV